MARFLAALGVAIVGVDSGELVGVDSGELLLTELAVCGVLGRLA
jgi:hypothetical protein